MRAGRPPGYVPACSRRGHPFSWEEPFLSFRQPHTLGPLGHPPSANHPPIAHRPPPSHSSLPIRCPLALLAARSPSLRPCPCSQYTASSPSLLALPTLLFACTPYTVPLPHTRSSPSPVKRPLFLSLFASLVFPRHSRLPLSPPDSPDPRASTPVSASGHCPSRTIQNLGGHDQLLRPAITQRRLHNSPARSRPIYPPDSYQREGEERTF